MRTSPYPASVRQNAKANIKNKAWYNITVPKITHPVQDVVEFNIDPYLLGALLGDGTICYRNIRFSTIDIEIAEKVSLKLNEGFSQELINQKNVRQKILNAKNNKENTYYNI